MLPEDTRLNADLERDELERADLRLTDPHLCLRQGRWTKHDAQPKRGGEKAHSRHRFPPSSFLLRVGRTIAVRSARRKQATQFKERDGAALVSHPLRWLLA